VAELRQSGMSFRQIVAQLNGHGIRTMRGGAWIAATVRNVAQLVNRLTPAVSATAYLTAPKRKSCRSLHTASRRIMWLLSCASRCE
jgi:hypothetical protein